MPEKGLVDTCKELAKQSGGSVTFETDPAKAAVGANVFYTDIWVSMGEPAEVGEERISDLSAYQVNALLLSAAGKDAVFMHSLPSYDY